MSFEFIDDLDEYFCEKYANYDRLCILPGYRMPKMQETATDAFGRTYSYTLPTERMSLAHQEKKAEILVALKEKMSDRNFSFSFRPLRFFERISDNFAKENFRKTLSEVARCHNVDPKRLADDLNVDPEVWKKILRGAFYPSKNTVFALSIANHFSYREAKALLQISGYDFGFENTRDVVISYLLVKGIYNSAMVEAALQEYKLLPLI